MFRNPRVRRKLAVLGIVLGMIFTAGVLWSVLTGGAEWWTLVLLIPALAIMLKLYGLLQRSGG